MDLEGGRAGEGFERHLDCSGVLVACWGGGGGSQKIGKRGSKGVQHGRGRANKWHLRCKQRFAETIWRPKPRLGGSNSFGVLKRCWDPHSIYLRTRETVIQRCPQSQSA